MHFRPAGAPVDGAPAVPEGVDGPSGPNSFRLHTQPRSPEFGDAGDSPDVEDQADELLSGDEPDNLIDGDDDRESISDFLASLGGTAQPDLQADLKHTQALVAQSQIKWLKFLLVELPSIALALATLPSRIWTGITRLGLAAIRLIVRAKDAS